MFIIKVVHHHPNVMDSILVSKATTKEEWFREMRSHGWTQDGEIFEKVHPRQNWKMRAFITKAEGIEKLD